MNVLDELSSFQHDLHVSNSPIGKAKGGGGRSGGGGDPADDSRNIISVYVDPMEKIRSEEKRILDINKRYRLSVLKHVATFAHLSPEVLETAAYFLDEVYYENGEHVIRQDERGDAFYIIEEGTVVVTKKKNSNDKHEIPVILATLGSNATFGEISLLTEEPRNATVTVTSPKAKILRMTKAKFQEVMEVTAKATETTRSMIVHDVVDMVPIFKGITGSQKERLVNAMIPLDFMPNSYICRQGTIGNTFYIITSGRCKVTIMTEDEKELDISTLGVGDFFGEIALLEMSNKRTANVISLENVSCLTLARPDFQKLFRNLKSRLIEHHAVKRFVGINVGQPLDLLKKRRVTAFDHHNVKQRDRTVNFFKRFSKTIVESLWSNLYARMYKRLLLSKSKNEYGDYAEGIITKYSDRTHAINALRRNVEEILEMDPRDRAASDHSLIIGLMSQRNHLKDRICKDWTPLEFKSLCRRVKLQRHIPMRRVFDVGSKGTTAYLIVRGCIRTFKRIKVMNGYKLVYEEDLCSGEIFGEEALAGESQRKIMAFTMTEVELLVIDYFDFVSCQDRVTSILSNEERADFLTTVPLFRVWEYYKLTRMAFVMLQQEVCKGSKIVKRGDENSNLILLLSGRVDVVTNTIPPHTITTIRKSEYFGETGFINSRLDKNEKKVVEQFNFVAMSRVDLLVIPADKFEWLSEAMYKSIKTAYQMKVEWRQQRNDTIIYEKRNGLDVSTSFLYEAIRQRNELGIPSEANKNHDSFFAPDSPDNSEHERHSVQFIDSPLRPLVEESRKKVVNFMHPPTLTHELDPLETVKHVGDLEDIPTIVTTGFDPLMVLPTCDTTRKMISLKETIKVAKEPKVVRVKQVNVHDNEDKGFKDLCQDVHLVSDSIEAMTSAEGKIRRFVHSPLPPVPDVSLSPLRKVRAAGEKLLPLNVSKDKLSKQRGILNRTHE